MPRLLSNKSPKKISDTKVEGSVLMPKAKKKSFVPPKRKSVDEMSSWEYYNFLMLFGKRKMDRFEWRIWKEKKDIEDWNKKYSQDGRRKICSREYAWRLKKDPDFDERMYVIDNNLRN